MNNLKISIIIPIFNVEKYLAKCLNSVLYNQIEDIEVICINDDSFDSCLNILNKYAKIDNRIKIINKKNEGQGIARNEGLKIAKGEYIFFLDPDDWINQGALEKMYNKIKQDDADILFFNVIKHFEKDKAIAPYKYIEPYYLKFKDKPFHPMDAKDVIYMTTAHPFKIYKRESIVKYNFKYTNNRHWEDHCPYFCFLANCEKISLLNEYVYNYLVRKSSSTNTSHRCMDDIFLTFYQNENELLKTKYGKEFINQFIWHKLNTFFVYMNIMPLSYKPKYFKKFKNVLKYIKNKYGEGVFAEFFELTKIILNSNYFAYEILNRLEITKIMFNSFIN